MKNMAIYGGTFDPPHLGHVKTAQAVQHYFQFDKLTFMPCKIPVLKGSALATSQQRLEMLKLALADYQNFTIDTRELDRDTPSYMVDTLMSIRKEWGDSIAITLCIGMDTFLQLPEWHAWQDILGLCHLLVMKRAVATKETLPNVLKKLLLSSETSEKQCLLTQPNGKIYCFDAGQYPISSTSIRLKIQRGEDVSSYLSETVYQYIMMQALYRSYPSA
jgi:nicotinate-nucleotide adenylyltransferase